MTTAAQQSEASAAKVDRKSAAWQDAQWGRWPVAAAWPEVLDVYESAAYLRIGYGSIWSACQRDRNGQARLAHQRIGSAYRIRRADLDRLGVVAQRRAA